MNSWLEVLSMDAQIESLVGLYLTRDGKVFISPQYDIAYHHDARDGGTCPDIVALDMERKGVVVVEITPPRPSMICSRR